MMHQTKLLLLCNFLCGFLAVISAFEFINCGSKVGKFTKVTVSNCDTTKAACDLIRNTNASLSIEFTALEDASAVSAVCHGIVMDIPIPFPLPHPDVCKDIKSGITCPLKKDGTYTYMANLPVDKSYPKLSVKVKWQLQNEKKEDIVCLLFPAKIK